MTLAEISIKLGNSPKRDAHANFGLITTIGLDFSFVQLYPTLRFELKIVISMEIPVLSLQQLAWLLRFIYLRKELPATLAGLRS